jgi:peptidoglycan/LPS O-acetylase OafA/YrhL
MRHRRDIEGLRAVAVVAVLLYHFGVPGFDGGYVGVDVFFVVSGFLITSLLVNERVSTGRVSLREFYARRVRRLLPISAVVLVATVVVSAVWLDVTRHDPLVDEIVAAALFGANLLFADRGTDYLASSLPPSPVQHYWSLSVEEQFYAVWPVLVAVATVGAQFVRRRLTAVLSLVVVVSFAASVMLTPSSPSWSYFGLHTRAWELAVGALLAVVTPRVGDSVRRSLGSLGLLAIAVSVVTFGGVQQFPGYAAALPVLGTVAVLAAGEVGGSGRLLSQPLLQWIGARSYSLYLWHWPILIVAESYVGEDLPWTGILAVALLTVGVSQIGYVTIENPVRRNGRLARDVVLSLSVGAALILTSLTAAWGLHRYEPDLSTGVIAEAPSLQVVSTTLVAPSTTVAVAVSPESSVSTAPIVSTTTTTVPPGVIRMGDAAPLAAVVEASQVTVVPDNLTPSLSSARYDTGLVYDNDCHVYYDTTVKTDCIFGDPNGSVTVALFGDSHAAQWFPALDMIARENGWRLLSLTQGGCPFIDVSTYNATDDIDLTYCQPWRDSVREYLRSQNVSVVFLSQYYRLRAASDRQAIAAAEYERLLPGLIDSFRADGIEPIVIADTPYFESEVPGCLANNRSRIDRCAPGDAFPELQLVEETMRRVVNERQVGFVEPRRWLCVESYCPPIVGNLLVYRDQSHLSATFVEWLTPALADILTPAISSL